MSNYNEDDQILTCDDCGKEFTYTVQEQDYFNQRGYAPPKRCPECRRAKKALINQVSDHKKRND